MMDDTARGKEGRKRKVTVLREIMGKKGKKKNVKLLRLKMEEATSVDKKGREKLEEKKRILG